MAEAKKPRAKRRRKAVRKDENVHVRVSAEQKKAMSAAAQRSGLSLSNWILFAALRTLNQNEGDLSK